MAYPDTKETFPRRTGRDLGIGDEGDLIPAVDNNAPVDFLERLEDTLGYSFLDDFADLASRIEFIELMAGLGI